jgi:hypothetical protein
LETSLVTSEEANGFWKAPLASPLEKNHRSGIVTVETKQGVKTMGKSMDSKKDAKKKPSKTLKEKKAAKKAKKETKGS